VILPSASGSLNVVAPSTSYAALPVTVTSVKP
jgi:hypothetical protein